MKIATVLVIALALEGCGDDPEKQAAQCHLQALRTYPKDDDIYRQNFMTPCMRAHDYEYAPFDDKRCVLLDAYNAYCYKPTTFWKRLGHHTEPNRSVTAPPTSN